MKSKTINPNWEPNERVFINALITALGTDQGPKKLSPIQTGVMQACCNMFAAEDHNADNEDENFERGYRALKEFFESRQFNPAYVNNAGGWIIDINEMPKPPNQASSLWIRGFRSALLDGEREVFTDRNDEVEFGEGYDFGCECAEFQANIDRLKHYNEYPTKKKKSPSPNNDEDLDEVDTHTPGGFAEMIEASLDTPGQDAFIKHRIIIGIIGRNAKFFREFVTDEGSVEYLQGLFQELEGEELAQFTEWVIETQPKTPSEFDLAIKTGKQAAKEGLSIINNPYDNLMKEDNGNHRANPLHMAWQAAFLNKLYTNDPNNEI